MLNWMYDGWNSEVWRFQSSKPQQRMFDSLLECVIQTICQSSGVEVCYAQISEYIKLSVHLYSSSADIALPLSLCCNVTGGVVVVHAISVLPKYDEYITVVAGGLRRIFLLHVD